MRTSDVLLPAFALIAAGCDRSTDPRVAAGDVARDAGRIACRLGDATSFATVCTVERTAGADGMTLTLRGPDGGFRRLAVARDGQGLKAADGAEPVTMRTVAGVAEIAIAGDHYRLPLR